MNELIEALLAFARVGRTEIQMGPVDMDRLTSEVIAEMEVETTEREVIWEISPLPQVECDRGTIRQVMVNLLGNAAKFTRSRSPARIQVGTLAPKPEDGEVVFYVKDNGAGFDQNQASVLFEPFQSLHRREEYEGCGIGLANVKRIIQKHGGRVWAEGEVGKGATFYFSLPGKKDRRRDKAFNASVTSIGSDHGSDRRKLPFQECNVTLHG
jgi:light-regulated signal transduction histidine kinase (bacteriophytochrome)